MNEYGDFKYNGLPVFDVDIFDFLLISNFIMNGGRLLSKNIDRYDLKEYYTKKGLKFIIRYNGIMVDMSKIGSKN